MIFQIIYKSGYIKLIIRRRKEIHITQLQIHVLSDSAVYECLDKFQHKLLNNKPANVYRFFNYIVLLRVISEIHILAHLS